MSWLNVRHESPLFTFRANMSCFPQRLEAHARFLHDEGAPLSVLRLSQLNVFLVAIVSSLVPGLIMAESLRFLENL